MKKIYQILVTLILFGVMQGCEPSGELDIHGRPVQILPPGTVRVEISEVSYGSFTVILTTSGEAYQYTNIAICRLLPDSSPDRLPTWEENTSSTKSIKPGQSQYTFKVDYYKTGARYTIRSYVHDDDFRVAYGDNLTFVVEVGGSTVSTPTKPTVAFSGDNTRVTLSSSLPAAAASVTERGFCITAPDIQPDRNTPRIRVSGSEQTFSHTVDTLRPGIQYSARSYLVGSYGLRFSEPLQIRIPAPGLVPLVTTFANPTIYYSLVTATGQVIDTHGAKVMQCGFQRSESPSEFSDKTASVTASLNPDSTFSTYFGVSLSGSGTYYYRAYVETIYGTGYGQVHSVVVPPFAQYQPSVTTDDSPELTASTATVTGAVTSDNGPPILERGFYYSKYHSSPTSPSVEVRGTTGSMTATLKDLETNTTYYYRAYAWNAAGTSYGQTRQFRIDASDYKIDFRDLTVKINTDRSVTLGAYIRDTKGQKIKERGFCWTASYSDPTISDNTQKDNSIYGSTYQIDIPAYRFTASQTYRARAYIVIDEGVIWYSDKYDLLTFTIPEK